MSGNGARVLRRSSLAARDSSIDLDAAVPVGRAADAATAPKSRGIVALVFIFSWLARAARRGRETARFATDLALLLTHRYGFEGAATSAPSKFARSTCSRGSMSPSTGFTGRRRRRSNAAPVGCSPCFATAPTACASTSTTALRVVTCALAQRRRSRHTAAVARGVLRSASRPAACINPGSRSPPTSSVSGPKGPWHGRSRHRPYNRRDVCRQREAALLRQL